ncbi:DHS-like NAD/FAD-binding domain-containing protein [Tothia fuscella]|uniref:DHS-like NAD/FAD-binding domain-containing protein n=1 Tax=Tothia fuscella TaxID=1048955 RepID=A0A9P4NSL2_9PEZI|nr:DHS-like NAD/FAD-binding domain-containing protein [Tothia fuscella]
MGSTSYPSPVSSQLSSVGNTPSPSPEVMASTPKRENNRNEDGSPPAKRRKTSSSPQPRITETLDLSSPVDQEAQLDKLLKVLYKKRKIVVVAGAGISVSAGIPDFRSETGLFKTLKNQHNLKSSGKDLFDASVYKDDDSTSQFHDMVRNLSTATKSAAATPFHHLLATLAKEKRLLRLYTQNVDAIDTSLPPLATQIPLGRKAPWPKTVQLHGSLEKMVCTKCHQVLDLEPQLFDGPVPPACRDCEERDDVRTQYAGKRSHGIGRLRPRMVLYNERNPDEEAIGSVVTADLKTRPDALIVVGTTLKVPGVKRIVKEMCSMVRDRRDGLTVWINSDPPPPGKDYAWDLIVQGPCDSVASKAQMPKWDDAFETVTDEHLQKVKAGSGIIQVVVPSPSPSKSRIVDRLQGVLTPLRSPRLGPQLADKKSATCTTSTKPKQISAATKKTNVSKPSKTTTTGKPKKVAAPKKTKNNPGFKKQNPRTLNFKATKATALNMNMEQKPHGRSGTKKVDSTQPMQPVSPASSRNNSNPPFRPPGPQRSKSYTDANGVPLTVDIQKTMESPKERDRIVTPDKIPNNMHNLLI